MPEAKQADAQQPAVERTGDPRFAGRVRRLALTSVAGLGLIWLLWAATLDTHPIIGAGLAGGLLLMPLILALSLRWPALRYALTVPSLLVGLALLAVCITALPEESLASAGWLLMTGGVLLGGVLGMWFWFRWMPVPARLVNPFSPSRWVMIGVHVSLIIAGLALVTLAALS